MARARDPRTYDLDDLRRRVLPERTGAVDDSIPQLASADLDLCGLALVLPDGTLRTSEQADVPVSVQSAVKPFLFALALVDTGGDALDLVGIEPTGESFDAIRLEAGTGRPPNPMVNAGALLTAALVDGDDVPARTARILRGLSAFAARDLEVDDDVAHSEHLLGDRNHALAHLMRSEGTLRVSADDAWRSTRRRARCWSTHGPWPSWERRWRAVASTPSPASASSPPMSHGMSSR